jgi:predicted ABC-type ATPase
MTQMPRLRMFAGPNGSGKSTIKSLLDPAMLGIYINPDDIQAYLEKNSFIDFSEYQIQTTSEEALQFFDNSTLLQEKNLQSLNQNLTFENNKILVPIEARHLMHLC